MLNIELFESNTAVHARTTSWEPGGRPLWSGAVLRLKPDSLDLRGRRHAALLTSRVRHHGKHEAGVVSGSFRNLNGYSADFCSGSGEAGLGPALGTTLSRHFSSRYIRTFGHTDTHTSGCGYTSHTWGLIWNYTYDRQHNRWWIVGFCSPPLLAHFHPPSRPWEEKNQLH